MATEQALNDGGRLRVLRHTQLMDTEMEEAFERLTKLACQILDAPVALVSLVDEERQFFKSCVGLGDPWKHGTPLNYSLCQYVVSSGGPLVITDLTQSSLPTAGEVVAKLGAKSYAGIPIKSAEGYTLGSFCVLKKVPHEWSATELNMLETLAKMCSTEVELRKVAAEKTELAGRMKQWLARMPIGAFVCDDAMKITSWNAMAEQIFGYDAAEALGQKPFELLFKPEARDDAANRMADMALTGDPEKIMLACVDKGKNEMAIAWTIMAILEPDGMFGGFIAMCECANEPKVVPALEF